MGSATFEIGDILGTQRRTKAKRLPQGGAMYCRIESVRQENQKKVATFQFQATFDGRRPSLRTKVKRMPPDTIFQISKNYSNNWVRVYRSSPVKDDSRYLIWDAFEMDLTDICNGDLDMPLRPRIVQKRGKNIKVIAECETTLRNILKTQQDKSSIRSFPLVQKLGKVGSAPIGVLEVKLASLRDVEAKKEIQVDSLVGEDDNDEYDNDDDYDEIGSDNPWEIDIASIPKPTVAPTTFQDYLEDGLKFDFCIGIDFTSSNGDPRIPGTLHDQSSKILNDYEECIMGIGSAIAKYSEQCTVWGFGAKFAGQTRHLFQLGNEKTVHGGVDGILEAYKSIFESDLIMSGPTLFDQVIQAAAARANKHKQAGRDPLRYCVLLILTDGVTKDIEETKRKLNVYISVPLSVIFVGIGRSDFSIMYALIQGQKGDLQRKNTTFVEFRQHQHDPMSLGLAALEELPNQLVEYMSQENIQPRQR